MQTKEATVEILNDLIKINNDRIAGYERAGKEINDLDVDLKAVFEGMVQESHNYKQELMNKINEIGDANAAKEVDDDSTTSGKIYRAWMDIKSMFIGSGRKTVLESCEFGEDAWRRAYKSAMEANDMLDEGVASLVRKQYDSQKQSHNLIKKYRDAHNALDD